MKKIYSFMLLAAAMLLSISVSADVTSTSELQTAFNNANDGDVIEIGADFSLDALVKIDLGTNSVTLDLQGHTISAASTLKEMFYLYKGKLLVTNGTIQHVGAPMNTSGSGIAPLIFKVFGTYGEVLPGEYTKLTIAENASLLVAGGGANYKSNGTFKDYCKGYCISINERAETAAATKALDTRVVGWPNQTGTADSKGLANGVLIEVNGHLSMMSKKGYCIKVNGNLVCPSNNDIAGTTFTRGGNSYTIAADWNQYTPKVILSSSATLVATANATGVAAIYAAGYGTWDIQCHAEGSCALAAKSGNIVVTDAVLTSTATEYSQPATKGSGIDAQGSAVLIESNASYAGNISVTFAGDTKVEAQAGYAIEEAVPTPASGSAVSSISIQGGAFEGGAQAGCITFSEGTLAKHDESTVITIGGGSYGDQTDAQKEATDQLISHIINGGNTYTTEVSTGSTSGTGVVLVITSGTTPGVQLSDLTVEGLYGISSLNSDSSINLSQVADGTTYELKPVVKGGQGDLTLGDIVMNGEDLTIIVDSGVTFTAKQLIMNDKARIIVKAGGKLIVSGKQGIIAPVHDNIELKANSEAQALFVVSPEVTSNRQPKATVQLYTIGKNAPSHPVWQRGTTPMAVFNSFSHDGQSVSGMGSAYRNWIMYYDEAAAQWTNINAYSEMKPFTAYAMTNNSPDGGVTYTFTGNLQGNVSDNIKLNTVGWNYMANSFMAPMQVKALIDTIMAQAGDNLDGTIYLYKGLQYVTINATTLDLFGSPQDSIAALSSFIVKTNNEPMTLDVNYRKSIFNYVVGGMQPAQAAPARRSMSNNNTTTICLQLTADNGEQDKVYFIEGNDYTAEYENGADAEKFMNENLNIYAAGDMNQSIVASDDINGTMLSFNTTDAYNYTISFSHVRGTEKALRDNQTGRIVAIENGTTYSFVAQANEAIEGRFEIIEAAKMPTDVEMLEAAPAKKGIFSLQGQYLGEDLRVLPAGIYVVNGQKIVK